MEEEVKSNWFLDRMKYDRISDEQIEPGNMAHVDEWLTYNGHIFFEYEDVLYQCCYDGGIWSFIINEKKTGEYVKTIFECSSFDEAVHAEIFNGKCFADLFGKVILLY